VDSVGDWEGGLLVLTLTIWQSDNHCIHPTASKAEVEQNISIYLSAKVGVRTAELWVELSSTQSLRLMKIPTQSSLTGTWDFRSYSQWSNLFQQSLYFCVRHNSKNERKARTHLEFYSYVRDSFGPWKFGRKRWTSFTIRNKQLIHLLLIITKQTHNYLKTINVAKQNVSFDNNNHVCYVKSQGCLPR